MSQARYEYDENSETWPYFVLTTILVPLVPATISKIYNVYTDVKTTKSESSTFKPTNWFKPYNHQEIEKFKSSNQRSKIFNKRNLFIVIGWILIFLLYLKISSTEVIPSETNFDPWKILEISESANLKVIKAAYRSLSLKYHPDKAIKSWMTQEEIDSIHEKYALINKANQALTDEDIRENFLKYGNPDGPNEIKHGIALPKFLIDGPTSPVLVVIYVFLIAIILPWVVSSWWNGVKSKTKQDIHVNTADYFMKVMVNASPVKIIIVDDILKFVSHAEEYTEINPSLTPEKVHAYLLSFINREKSENEKLRLKIVAVTPKLLNAFIEIAAAFKNTDYCLKLVDAHRALIQALNVDKDSKYHQYKQILQLPGVDPSKVDFSQRILTLGKLLKKPTIDPSKFLGTSESETKKILDYGKTIPLLEPLECKFKVPGEDFIPPNSSSHISLKFITKSPVHKSKPELKNFNKDKIETQFKEEETMENLRDPMNFVAKQKKLELDNLPPYFPDVDYIKSNCGWIAFLVAQRDNKVVEIPKLMNKVDTDNLNLSQDDYMKSECNISTFKIQLQGPTPPTVGEYQFRLVIRNLIYFGSDLDIPIVMKVEDKPIESVQSDVYGIEDPDEDTIAGAMASIRGDPVKKIEFDNEYESSDDEDEEEEEELWTDIDTDTEVEEDATDEIDEALAEKK